MSEKHPLEAIVEVLESMVKNISENMENIEAKLKEVEESQMKCQYTEDKVYLNDDCHVNQKHVENIIKQLVFEKVPDTSYQLKSHTDEAKQDGESLVENKEDKASKQEVLFHCDKCDNKNKKESIFKNCIITKHQDQKCKVCDSNFRTSIELLKHIA